MAILFVATSSAIYPHLSPTRCQNERPQKREYSGHVPPVSSTDASCISSSIGGLAITHIGTSGNVNNRRCGESSFLMPGSKTSRRMPERCFPLKKVDNESTGYLVPVKVLKDCKLTAMHSDVLS